MNQIKNNSECADSENQINVILNYKQITDFAISLKFILATEAGSEVSLILDIADLE